MSELRTDPLTGHTVYLAEKRAGRPNDFVHEAAAEQADDTPRAGCPFCPGSEQQTPDATFELLDSVGAWQVRAVPNKYPLLDATAGQGVHEVIIESPRHVSRTGQLTVDEITNVLTVYAERLSLLANDSRFPYRLIFKNVGPSAGASLTHLHSQLVALPSLPSKLVHEAEQLAVAHRRNERCPWCVRIEDERVAGERVVVEREGWLAFCPKASRQPFETCLLPIEHARSFEALAATPNAIASLAGVLLDVVRAVEQAIGVAGYNLVLQTAAHNVIDGHWRIEIVPRIGSLAGFELATGRYVNTLSPEHAAQQLRKAVSLVGR